MASTGDRIRDLREKKGWTLDVLAEKSKLSKGFLSEAENDKTNIGSKILLQIADALGTSVDYLLKGGANKPKESDPVVIPPELSEAAKELNLPYTKILELLGAHNSVVARRSNRKQKNFSVDDWKELYFTIKRLFK
jgi:transcriptional regulator with XRE-family HTH domain